MTMVPDDIRREPAPFEQVLLWRGRPKQGVLPRESDAFQIPFSVLWSR